MNKHKRKFAFALVIAMLFTFAMGSVAFAAADGEAVVPEEIAEAVAEEAIAEDVIIEEVVAQEEPAQPAYNAAAEAELAAIDLSYIAGEVIVVFEEGSGSAAQACAEEQLGEVQSINNISGVGDVALVKISRSQTVADAMAAYSGKPGVRYVQPNNTYKALEVQKSEVQEAEVADAEVQAIQNDPGLSKQWYLDKVNAGKASDILEALPKKEKVLVAVIDEGADINHEDLTNIYNKELNRDFVNQKIEPFPEKLLPNENHATHVSGIIAAEANNGKGIAGVASGTKNQMVELMSCRVLGENGGTAYAISLGIDWAVECGADVINMSLGGFSSQPMNAYTRLEREACDAAVSNGTVVICAAGNDDSTDYSTPSDFESVISVIATTNFSDPKAYCRTTFSNYGVDKDISAPGERIYSTIQNNKYEHFNGTSMAAPVVAGVAAMMKYANPDITPAQIQEGMETTAVDLSSIGFDRDTAWGNIDAQAAVNYALNIKPPVPPVPVPPMPESPKDLKATEASVDGIKLEWSKSEGADGYYILWSNNKYKSDYDSYKPIAVIESNDITSYLDSKIKIGERNNYSVVSYALDENGEKVNSGFGNMISVTVKCAAPTGFTAKGQNKSTILVSWDETKKADGYYLYRSTKKTEGYKLTARFAGGEGVTYYDRDLKAGTKYYYKLIAFADTGAEYGIVRGATAGPIAGQTKSK